VGWLEISGHLRKHQDNPGTRGGSTWEALASAGRVYLFPARPNLFLSDPLLDKWGNRPNDSVWRRRLTPVWVPVKGQGKRSN